MSIGIVYYTDNQLADPICHAVVNQLLRATSHPEIGYYDYPICAVTLNATENQRNGLDVVNRRWHVEDFRSTRGVLTMFAQILKGLDWLDTDHAFLCEHDVLYHPSHFLAPLDGLAYNQNVWKVDANTGHALHYDCSQVSGLSGPTELLRAHYAKRIALVEQHGFSLRMGYEPGTHQRPERVDDLTAVTWASALPNIDIRHSTNLSPSRWSRDQFRDQRHTAGWVESDTVPGWGTTEGRFDQFIAALI